MTPQPYFAPTSTSTTTQTMIANKVRATQKTASINLAVRAVDERKSSPAMKAAAHQKLFAARIAPPAPALPSNVAAQATAKTELEKTVKSVERKMYKTSLAARSKEKEKEKGSGKGYGEKMWDLEKVLAVPPAIAAADDSRLGLVGRLTAYSEVKDSALRKDIADLMMSEMQSTTTSSTTSTSDIPNACEVHAVIQTPRLLEPYIEHCKREIALSEGMPSEAVRMADVALLIPPPPGLPAPRPSAPPTLAATSTPATMLGTPMPPAGMPIALQASTSTSTLTA